MVTLDFADRVVGLNRYDFDLNAYYTRILMEFLACKVLTSIRGDLV